MEVCIYLHQWVSLGLDSVVLDDGGHEIYIQRKCSSIRQEEGQNPSQSRTS